METILTKNDLKFLPADDERQRAHCSYL